MSDKLDAYFEVMMEDKDSKTPVMTTDFVYLPNGELIRYDLFVKKLFKEMTPEMMKAHIGLGITGEAGEFADAIKKEVIYGKPVDLQNILEELGDLLFYIQAACTMYGLPKQYVLQYNAHKLSERYVGLAYSDKAAISRADKSDVKDVEDVKEEKVDESKSIENNPAFNTYTKLITEATTRYVDIILTEDPYTKQLLADNVPIVNCLRSRGISETVISAAILAWQTREKGVKNLIYRCAVKD